MLDFDPDFDNLVLSPPTPPSNHSFTYNRYNCKDNIDVEKRIAAFYDVESRIKDTNGAYIDTMDCMLTSSGMNAISLAVNACIEKLKKIVYTAKWHLDDPDEHDYNESPYPIINITYGAEMYCDTERTLKYIEKTHRCIIRLIKLDLRGSIDAVMADWRSRACPHDKKFCNIFLFESASNPNGELFRSELIGKFRKESSDMYTIIDNTWLTHLGCNPLSSSFGGKGCIADLIVTSLTKYYSGGTIIAGAIIGWKEEEGLVDTARYRCAIPMGAHVSGIVGQIVAKALDTFGFRLSSAQSKAQTVVETIDKTNPHFYNLRIAKVDTDDHHFYAPVFMIFYQGVSKNSIVRKCKKSKDVGYKTSYGGSDHRIDPYLKSKADGIVCIRVSVGWKEDIKPLVRLLNSI